jgi:ABC-type nitrate/sulfonate/bicarbonate transport system substrate-binding protein
MKVLSRLKSGTVALLVAANLLTAPAHAQAPANVTVNVFPGGFNWPSFVGQQKGFFERNGITVTLQPTPNSVAQMTGLAEGKFDIAMTAFDNIVASELNLISSRSWAATTGFCISSWLRTSRGLPT